MQPLWYRDAVIYQVDPSRFFDVDGDGRGDLVGVTARLEHLRGLGVNCLWLLPVHPSPFRDGGYDVTDHLGVDHRFGDLADFVTLVEKAEELGIRVLMDLVVQHVSVDHRWFQEARRDPSSPYRDWFVWTDHPESDEATVEPIFPTVEDSVWTWDEEAGQYYRHVFYSHEPDLNHANPEVFEEICRIIGFWMRLGVSGFRVDAVPHMVERARHARDRRDEPGGADGTWLIRRIRDHVRLRQPEAVLLGEVDVDPEGYADYFAGDDGLMLLLDFWANNHVWLSLARKDARPLARALREQPVPPERAAYANFLRNHDELDLERLGEDERAEVLEAFAPQEHMRVYDRGIRRRLAPMLGHDRERLAMAHALLMALPGVPVMLYGDEVGLGDDLDQPERLAVRTPMPWDEVADQTLDGDSLLTRVGKMVRARVGMRELSEGSYEPLDVGVDSVLGLRYERGGTLAVLLTNLADREVDVQVPNAGDMVDVLADAPYDRPDGEKLRLGPWGYRWLRPRRDLFR